MREIYTKDGEAKSNSKGVKKVFKVHIQEYGATVVMEVVGYM